MSIDSNKIMNVAAAKVLYDDLRARLEDKVENRMIGKAYGIAQLDANKKVPSSQLPSYVDDVIEFASFNNFPLTGESGKIYIASNTNRTYRWSGSTYVEISSSLALGETESSAYRGDRGAIAYEHAENKGNAYTKGLYKVATNTEGHVVSAQSVTKQDITNLGIPGEVPTKISQLQNDSGFIASFTQTDPTVPAWAKTINKPVYTASEVGALPDDTIIPTKLSDLTNDVGYITSHQDISGKADKTEIPTKVSQLQNDAGYLASTNIPTKVSDLTNDVGYISSYTETDPTVPSWAKSATKPVYTAQEVGALPSDTVIPTKISDLTNDSGFISSYTETDPTVPAWAKATNKPSYTASEVGALPDSTVIPTKVSDLTNDAGYLISYTETDPTVPAWAKGANKPSYTAAEVGALPDNTVIPTKVSDLTNDAGYITSYTETDPTVPAWAKASSKPTYTASEVGALPDSTVIPTKVSDLTNDAGYLTAHQDISGKANIADVPTKISDLVDDSGHYTKPSGGIPASDLASGVIPDLTNYVQNTDYATDSTAGVVKIDVSNNAIGISNGILYLSTTTEATIKNGTSNIRPIFPHQQHISTFYGLAKAAGDTTQASSNNAVGTYTASAKTAIQTMLGVEAGVTYVENVTGSTPTITANANTRYVCGELTSLSFTPCVSGVCDVIFTSGSTVTVLTVPNTIKWPGWFDPTSLDVNTIYEINILDGTYGVVAVWAT